MSRIRHEPCVRSLGLSVAPGHRIEPHAHEWPQLVYAVSGVISAAVGAGNWIVPPMRALWLDAGTEHTLSMRGRVEMRTLYFRPDVAPRMAEACCVIDVPPLLRELVVHVVGAGGLDCSLASGRALFRVLVDQLRVVPERPLALPIPTDERAKRVAMSVLSRPGGTMSLEQLVRRAGISARTAERLFLTQTGMPFGRWRQHARLHESIRLLGEGLPVVKVALQVGYRSPSAFVAAFRKCFGRTPAQYYQRAT
ncbi:MAG: helix-turn-helix transcriptional regulator [Phycisphaeraceae bacterium]|nr:helix-turn-helix transcriptional regulator [Phycisphaeraceae bacterium]